MTKTRKPNGYWESLKNTIAEAMRALEEQEWDTLPSHSQLIKHRYSSLIVAINKYHGGIQNIRTKLGQTNNKKPNRYWQSLDNTLAEARKAMHEQEWNILPSNGKLQKHGYSSLGRAIKTYHGKIQQFRTKLGQTNNKKPNRYWEKKENAIAEATKAMEEQGWATLPSADVLKKYRYSALSYAICTYHGGYPAFRTLLTEHKTGKTQKQQLEELLDEYIAA